MLFFYVTLSQLWIILTPALVAAVLEPLAVPSVPEPSVSVDLLPVLVVPFELLDLASAESVVVLGLLSDHVVEHSVLPTAVPALVPAVLVPLLAVAEAVLGVLLEPA